METKSKHSFFKGLEGGGVIQRKVSVRPEFFRYSHPTIMQDLYQSTWREFALAVLEGLEHTKQPVVIETDFAEYTDDVGMRVLHFKAVYTPVRFRDVTFLRNIPLEIEYVNSVKAKTFWQRLKYVVTGKV